MHPLDDSPTPVPVLLMDLGGPADEDGVHDFLVQLFSDPAMFPLPWGVRHAVARLVAWRRAPHAVDKYREIGGSPVPAEAERLRSALQDELGEAYRVLTAFRYAPPSAAEAVRALSSDGALRAIAAPAFPQWSHTTWGTCLGALEGGGVDIAAIEPFSTAPGFIDAVVGAIQPLVGDDTHVLLTAHGLPQRLVDRGDPYAEQVRATAAAVGARLEVPWSLAFQSRLGPVEWLRPYLEDEIAALGAAGVAHLLVAPVSFATENLETRWDLDREAAELAQEAGIGRFDRAPAPGPDLAPVLAARVHEVST